MIFLIIILLFILFLLLYFLMKSKKKYNNFYSEVERDYKPIININEELKRKKEE